MKKFWKKFWKGKKRPELYVPLTYGAEANKTEQPFVFEHPDGSWTTSDYVVPKDFVKYYSFCFGKRASEMVKSVDEGVPNYMDQSIYDATAEALGYLIHKHSAHAESISEIISRKKVTRNCLERELEAVKAEKERICALVEEIVGYDYE